MIAAYVKVREPRDEADVTSKLNDVRDRIKANSELVDLLSRPVHIPMFVTILPEFAGDVSELSRGFLYETFVKKIIMREVLRLPPAYQQRYTTEQRFEFVGSLAFEMAKRGETRSIRRSEIPPDIVRPFVNQGESIEIASRDLVAACFLEQKPPDILSFGHKSFLEFLTAHYLLHRTRGGAGDHTLIYPTREIGSFVLDLCEIQDVDRCLQGSWESREFMVSCLLQSVSEFAISPRYRRVSSGTSRKAMFGIGVLVSEKIAKTLHHFASPKCIAALSRMPMSAQIRHITCLVLYLNSYGLRVKSYKSDQGSGSGAMYSEETWRDIDAIATTDEARQLVSHWRREIERLSTSPAVRSRAQVTPFGAEAFHEHMEFLSSHYRQAFNYHASLAVIPGGDRSSTT